MAFSPVWEQRLRTLNTLLLAGEEVRKSTLPRYYQWQLGVSGS